MIRVAATSRAARSRPTSKVKAASWTSSLPDLRPLPSWILAQGERRLAGRSVVPHGDDIWGGGSEDDPDALEAGEGGCRSVETGTQDRAAIAARAALAAGAALLGLDRILRLETPWLSALRMRQALAAATASGTVVAVVKLAGRAAARQGCRPRRGILLLL